MTGEPSRGPSACSRHTAHPSRRRQAVLDSMLGLTQMWHTGLTEVWKYGSGKLVSVCCTAIPLTTRHCRVAFIHNRGDCQASTNHALNPAMTMPREGAMRTHAKHRHAESMQQPLNGSGGVQTHMPSTNMHKHAATTQRQGGCSSQSCAGGGAKPAGLGGAAGAGGASGW